MSQQNVDRIRDAYAAFNCGDVDAVSDLLHPEVEWRPYIGALEGTVYHGRDEIREMWSNLEEGFGDSFQVEIEELIDRGEKVAIVLKARAIGSGSGVEVRHSWVQVATMRDGLVALVEPYPDREAALAALGDPEGAR